MSLAHVADELGRSLSSIFLPDSQGHRPVFGHAPRVQRDPPLRDHVRFYEYFHGDNGLVWVADLLPTDKDRG